MPPPGREPFTAVEPSPLYQQIADVVRTAIVEGRFRPGDALPPERELAEEFNVSRVTVREALRQLEAQGLVVGGRTAQGRRISEDSLKMLSRAVADTLLLQGVSLGDLVDLRCAVECAAIDLASARQPPGPMEEARRALDAMRQDDSQFDVLDVQFHRALVAASGNLAMQAVMSACRESQVHYLSRALKEHPNRETVTDLLTAQHEGIFEAVEAGNGSLAAERTEAHIRGFYAVADDNGWTS